MSGPQEQSKKKKACAHGHHHHHHAIGGSNDDLSEGLDPGHQALAQGLRSVFFLLKVAMVVVVVGFLASGAYKVEQNQIALELRFGALKGGDNISAIKKPGWHWALPTPIEEVVLIPSDTAVREVDVDSFWYYQTEDEKLGVRKGRPGPTLQFVRDGYSLTASAGAALGDLGDTAASHATDYNIVHTGWRINYRITDPQLFFKKLWHGKQGVDGKYDWTSVETLLKSALADAVILTSANWDIDYVVWERTNQFTEQVQDLMEQRLDALEVGLKAQLVLADKSVPRQVEEAFNQATSAGIAARKFEREAEAKRDEILSAAQANAKIRVAQAEAYHTRLVQSAAADAKYLQEVLARIDESAVQRVPATVANWKTRRQQIRDELLAVTVDQLYQEMLRTVLSNADETFVLNATEGASMEWRAVLSRDAAIGKSKKATTNRASRYMPTDLPSAAPPMPPGGPGM